MKKTKKQNEKQSRTFALDSFGGQRVAAVSRNRRSDDAGRSSSSIAVDDAGQPHQQQQPLDNYDDRKFDRFQQPTPADEQRNSSANVVASLRRPRRPRRRSQQHGQRPRLTSDVFGSCGGRCGCRCRSSGLQLRSHGTLCRPVAGEFQQPYAAATAAAATDE